LLLNTSLFWLSDQIVAKHQAEFSYLIRLLTQSLVWLFDHIVDTTHDNSKTIKRYHIFINL
jgi:hypothetical protein